MLDAKVVIGLFDVSNHYVVLGKLRIRGRRVFSRNSGRGKVSKVLASERLGK